MIDVVDARSVPARVLAVALVLHGGRDTSRSPVTPNQLAVRRMRPFARSLASRRRSAGRAVWSLQYRFRGWNGTDRPGGRRDVGARAGHRALRRRAGGARRTLDGRPHRGARGRPLPRGRDRGTRVLPGSHTASRSPVTGRGCSWCTGARHHDQPAALPRLGAKSRPSPTRWWVGIRRRTPRHAVARPCGTEWPPNSSPRPSGSEPRWSRSPSARDDRLDVELYYDEPPPRGGVDTTIR